MNLKVGPEFLQEHLDFQIDSIKLIIRNTVSILGQYFLRKIVRDKETPAIDSALVQFMSAFRYHQ